MADFQSQLSLSLGHFAHAGDLLTRALLADADVADDPTARSERLWRLAACKRGGGHLPDALRAARRAQDTLGAAACSCEAHFEEGAAWQALDCFAAAAACFRLALAINPAHGPSVEGAAFVRGGDSAAPTAAAASASSAAAVRDAVAVQPLTSDSDGLVDSDEHWRRALGGSDDDDTGQTPHTADDTALAKEYLPRPTTPACLSLGAGAPRGAGVVVVRCADLLPEALAKTVVTTLRAAPATSWRLNERGNSGSAAAQANRGISAANMSFWMYIGTDLDTALPALRPQLSLALGLLPHERLLLNASKYTEGSFLDAHTDAPSGSASHERVRAFVWHLSEETFTDIDGGVFVDEESHERFVPAWNTLVHFEVPRWHSVSKMVTPGKERVSIYGWVVVPKVAIVPSEDALQLTLYQHRMVALYWPAANAGQHAAATHADAASFLATSSSLPPSPLSSPLSSPCASPSISSDNCSLALLAAFGAAAHRPAPRMAVGAGGGGGGGGNGGGGGAVTRGDYIRFCVATEPWATLSQHSLPSASSPSSSPPPSSSTSQSAPASSRLIPDDVVATGRPAVLLFVDCVLVGSTPVIVHGLCGDGGSGCGGEIDDSEEDTETKEEDNTSTDFAQGGAGHQSPMADALECLLDSAWSHLRGAPPVLRSRNAWEDRLCLAAMRFNTRLPLLALIVGRSAGHQRVDEEVMRTVRAITDALMHDAFVYVTTNTKLCVAFGGITVQQTPTAVLHSGGSGGSGGGGGDGGCSGGSSSGGGDHGGSGGGSSSFQRRLVDASPPSFEAANVEAFVRRCLALLRVEKAKEDEREREEEEVECKARAWVIPGEEDDY